LYCIVFYDFGTNEDAGNNGRVVYTSLIGSEAFRLDAVTGEITVDKSDILDRETEPGKIFTFKYTIKYNIKSVVCNWIQTF
jgi:hypothetical protein